MYIFYKQNKHANLLWTIIKRKQFYSNLLNHGYLLTPISYSGVAAANNH